eukprot:352209-Hanusia_phi.AAC.6
MEGLSMRMMRAREGRWVGGRGMMGERGGCRDGGRRGKMKARAKHDARGLRWAGGQIERLD